MERRVATEYRSADGFTKDCPGEVNIVREMTCIAHELITLVPPSGRFKPSKRWSVHRSAQETSGPPLSAYSLEYITYLPARDGAVAHSRNKAHNTRASTPSHPGISVTKDRQT